MKDVPHIIERTGIGADAFHPYQARILAYYSGMSTLIQFSREHPIKNYEEIFPTTEFKYVVNDKNRQRVTQLNVLAEEANRTLTHDGCTLEELVRIVKRACELVYNDAERVAQLREVFPDIDIKKL